MPFSYSLLLVNSVSYVYWHWSVWHVLNTRILSVSQSAVFYRSLVCSCDEDLIQDNQYNAWMGAVRKNWKRYSLNLGFTTPMHRFIKALLISVHCFLEIYLSKSKVDFLFPHIYMLRFNTPFQDSYCVSLSISLMYMTNFIIKTIVFKMSLQIYILRVGCPYEYPLERSRKCIELPYFEISSSSLFHL